MRSPTKAGATSPGRQAARDAWLAQHPRVLVIGMLGCTAPLLDPDVGFYVASLGCDWTESKIQFVDDYNAELKRLVEEQGYPEWGPLCRRTVHWDPRSATAHAASEVLIVGGGIVRH